VTSGRSSTCSNLSASSIWDLLGLRWAV
jgi:hypothetical protein